MRYKLTISFNVRTNTSMFHVVGIVLSDDFSLLESCEEVELPQNVCKPPASSRLLQLRAIWDNTRATHAGDISLAPKPVNADRHSSTLLVKLYPNSIINSTRVLLSCNAEM